MRLDLFLWWARIVKKRDWAQAMAEAGHLRIDGRPVAKAAVPVHVGQVLSFATHTGRVRAIRVAALAPDTPLWFVGDLHGDLLALEG